MKFIYLIIALSILSLNTFADQKAEEILAKVTKATDSYNSIEAEFSFIMSNTEEDIEEKNEGNILIQNDQFKLDLMGAEIYFDGEKQYTYVPDDNSVMISIPDPQEELINPAKIFTIYQEGFKNNYVGTTSYKQKSMHHIELVPEEIEDFNKVTLYINQDMFQIKKAIMHGTDGNNYIIEIGNYKTTQKYPKDIFKFDTKKYKDLEIIEI